MRGRDRAASLAASPVLVGAVTVLVTVVAVFLAYQANRGLPFVPTYRISVIVPNADTLVPGNEVRIGGFQVGVVERIEPCWLVEPDRCVDDLAEGDNAPVQAKLDLKLEQQLEPLPEDSTVVVRARSALGLKYLELNEGDSTEGYPAGATVPVTAARPEPVDLDEVLNTFDEPTRAAVQANLTEFGNALAGRGRSLNAALGELAPLVKVLEPVMRNLASPQTQLARFVNAISATAAEVAPVADQQGRLFVSLDRTFAAFADVARPHIQETISRTPPTLDAVSSSLPPVRPFLRNTAGLFVDLQPGLDVLRPSAPVLADALVAGIPALRASPALNRQLPPTTQALVDLSNDAAAREGIDDLDDAIGVARSLIGFVGPAQSVCNYATLLLRNVSDMWRIGDGLGTWQFFLSFVPPTGPNNEGSPSSAPANAPGFGSQAGNVLHSNPYPNTAAPGQTRECEAGNEPYITGRPVIGNVPGNQGIHTNDQLPEQRK